jgi:nucleoside-diphosphate-sugar epimerase
MHRQPGPALIPEFGGADESRINLVPRDFVIDAIDHLSALPHSLGRTYQLADPAPPTIREAVELIAAATGKRVLRVRVARTATRKMLAVVPGLSRFTGIQPEALDYFDHPTHYAVQHASTDLRGSEISVPAFSEYVDRLVRFVRAHPEVSDRPMA